MLEKPQEYLRRMIPRRKRLVKLRKLRRERERRRQKKPSVSGRNNKERYLKAGRIERSYSKNITKHGKSGVR